VDTVFSKERIFAVVFKFLQFCVFVKYVDFGVVSVIWASSDINKFFRPLTNVGYGRFAFAESVFACFSIFFIVFGFFKYGSVNFSVGIIFQNHGQPSYKFVADGPWNTKTTDTPNRRDNTLVVSTHSTEVVNDFVFKTKDNVSCVYVDFFVFRDFFEMLHDFSAF